MVAIEYLDRQQTFALDDEIKSTRNLLAYGIRAIRTAAFIETTRDPIMTMLSIGVEKLYKLARGVIILDQSHQWPTKAEMKNWGHDLVRMHEVVMGELRTRSAVKSPYVRERLADVDNDPIVVPTINALDLYGRIGRFYYLDVLGGDPQPVSPDEAWQAIEDAGRKDPAIAEARQGVLDNTGDNEFLEAYFRTLHERIAVAVESVWVAVAVCGRNGVLGETGGTFGFQVHPSSVGRQ